MSVQSRRQSPRYPCPVERENEDLWVLPQRSNECTCLSHARAIEREWEWVAISIEKSKRQNGDRFKFRGICFHFAGIRQKQNS